jgi:hypothetical protein
MKTIISFTLFFFLSCNSKNQESNNDILNSEVNKLKREVKFLKNEILHLKKCKAKSWIYYKNDLTFYDSSNFAIKLFSKRPDKKNNQFVLSIPAAFTDNPRNNHNLVDGCFIEKGIKISNDYNEDLSGTCVISNNIPIIYESKNLPQVSKSALANKSSLFQQFLLVYKHKIISNIKFENKPSSKSKLIRRALAEIDNQFYIVESKLECSIIDFQNLLVSNNVKNAIYLDMGTYSEGWYRNEFDKTATIGKDMKNTNNQSNWIVYEKI